VVDDDINKNERFLLYSGQEGRLLVFCADTELESIYYSHFLICDGTFEMSPDSAYQLYTIHGYVEGDEGKEGMPLLWALLPNKSKQTYVELFQALHRALTVKYGDAGDHVFLTDFERAAIMAIEETFKCTVKGCTFHFRQAILRHVQNEGLRFAYYGNSHPTVRKWIRKIMAMSLLPAFVVPMIWNGVLKTPPPTGQPEVDLKTAAFAAYVENTWINGDFPPSLWTHFDNEGPRTTNLAEGWHNSLNSKFGVPHPSMRTFLDWLQKAQFDIQAREMQLADGRKGKPREKKYMKLDGDIAAAKVAYGFAIGHIFEYKWLNPQPLRLEIAMPQFMNTTMDYLGRVSYFLLGGHKDGDDTY
jgi:hypothetical protein